MRLTLLPIAVATTLAAALIAGIDRTPHPVPPPRVCSVTEDSMLTDCATGKPLDFRHGEWVRR